MIGLIYLLPLAVIGVAGLLGFHLARLFMGDRDMERELVGPLLAIFIPVVGASAVLMSDSTMFAELYGARLSFLWIWTLAAFAAGLLIGWANSRPTID